MGNSPSKANDEQIAELKEKHDDIIERAAGVIATADVLLVATGAGWSADSGLAIYRDVADVEAYRTRGLTYHDLCQPQVLNDDPALFIGFWGGCMNDYRATKPHDGYNIIAGWRKRLFQHQSVSGKEIAKLLRNRDDSRPEMVAGPFFSLTSNVDAHWLQGFAASEVYECHGNTEMWQCASRECKNQLALETKGQDDIEGVVDASWRAPPGFAFAIDEETRLAAEIAAPSTPASSCCDCWQQPYYEMAFACNWPKCVKCNGMARPAVLMFNDSSWACNHTARDRWDDWQTAVQSLSSARADASASGRASSRTRLKVAVLEIGCGANVTTIRQKTESFVRELCDRGARATIIRVNPEYPLADSDAARPVTLPVLSTGLAAVQQIDRALQWRLGAGTANHAGAEEDPMAGLTFEHIDMTKPVPAIVEAEDGSLLDGVVTIQSSKRRLEAAKGCNDALGSDLPLQSEPPKQGPARADEQPHEKGTQIDKVLAEIRETQKKFERFDQLGEQLKGVFSKLATGKKSN